MPLYDYRCDYCRETFEFQHPMNESMDGEACPTHGELGCPGGLKKAFLKPPPMKLDGTGWTKQPTNR